MILRLLLLTGQYRHKQNLHIVYCDTGWLMLQICTKKKVTAQVTQCKQTAKQQQGAYMINATSISQIWNWFLFYLSLPYNHCICILSFIYLPNSMESHDTTVHTTITFL